MKKTFALAALALSLTGSAALAQYDPNAPYNTNFEPVTADPAPQDHAVCSNWGLTRGSAAYGECRAMLYLKRDQDQKDAMAAFVRGGQQMLCSMSRSPSYRASNNC